MIHKSFIETEGGAVARVSFILPDSIWAETIHLVGDFNDWSRTAHPFHRDSTGKWTLNVDLELGRAFQFRYLCDDKQWMNDWGADAYVYNPYGSDNFVVITDPNFRRLSQDQAGAGESAALRRYAEEKLRKQPVDLEKLSAEEAQRLIHELQIHRIEWEIQNERLRRAQQELATSHRRYSDLYDFAPIGYFTMNENGLIMEANLTGAALLGVERERLIKKPLSLFIAPEDQDKFLSYCQKVLATQMRQNCELKLERNDSAQFYAQLESIAVQDSVGTLSQIRTAISDITERKRAEKTLRRRNVQLQTAAEVSRAASSILNVDRLIRQSVELIRERFGLYYVGLFLADAAREFAVLCAGTGEPGQQMMAQGHKLKVGGVSMIGQCVARAEARIALDVGVEAVRFDNPLLPDTRSEMALPLRSRGQVIGALTVQSVEEAAFDEASIAVMQTMTDQVATAIDNARLYTSVQQELAERKRAEDKLRESEARYRVLVETMNEGLIVGDVNASLIYVNDSFCEMLGYAQAEMVDHNLAEFLDEAYLHILEEQLARRRKGAREPYELVFDHRAGEKVYTIISPNALLDANGAFVGSFAVVTDITARKQVGEALRESEERFRTVADFTYNWEYWIGADGNYIYVSPSCERVTGYRAHEFLKDPELLETITHPDDRATIARHLHEELGSSEVFSIDFRIITRNGDERWIAHVCQPVCGTDGKRLGRRASNRDITARKRAEAEREAARELLQTAIDGVNDPVMLIGTDHRVKLMNQAVRDNYPVGKETEPLHCYQIFHHRDTPCNGTAYPCPLEQVRESLRPVTVVHEHVRRDGEKRLVEITVSPLLGKDGTLTGIVESAHDITKRVQVEEALRVSEARYRAAHR